MCRFRLLRTTRDPRKPSIASRDLTGVSLRVHEIKRVPPIGFEPTTSALGKPRSIQLSYEGGCSQLCESLRNPIPIDRHLGRHVDRYLDSQGREIPATQPPFRPPKGLRERQKPGEFGPNDRRNPLTNRSISITVVDSPWGVNVPENRHEKGPAKCPAARPIKGSVAWLIKRSVAWPIGRDRLR